MEEDHQIVKTQNEAEDFNPERYNQKPGDQIGDGMRATGHVARP